MVVDAHSHFTPRSIIEQLHGSAGTFPSVQVKDYGEGRFGFIFPDSPPTRPMQPRLWDIAAAHNWMDEEGIEMHVVGPWSDIFGYTLPADEAASWCHFVNEAMLRALDGQHRFVPLAIVPLQSGAHAARELESAHAMGYRGLT